MAFDYFGKYRMLGPNVEAIREECKEVVDEFVSSMASVLKVEARGPTSVRLVRLTPSVAQKDKLEDVEALLASIMGQSLSKSKSALFGLTIDWSCAPILVSWGGKRDSVLFSGDELESYLAKMVEDSLFYHVMTVDPTSGSTETASRENSRSATSSAN